MILALYQRFLVVREMGLEPTRLATQEPKSCASTNFATRAVPRAGKPSDSKNPGAASRPREASHLSESN